MPPARAIAAIAGLAGGACLVATSAAGAAPVRPAKATGAATEIAVCVNRKTGAMRMLKKPTQRCRKAERKVRWGVRGPAGATGPAGAVGATGAPGESGLMAAFASGTPSMDVSAGWTTVMSTSFTGQPNMIYRTGKDFPDLVLGTCPGGGNFTVYSRVLTNGVAGLVGTANVDRWRPRSGVVTLELQMVADTESQSGFGAPCAQAGTYTAEYANLYVQAARRP